MESIIPESFPLTKKPEDFGYEIEASLMKKGIRKTDKILTKLLIMKVINDFVWENFHLQKYL